MLICDDAALRSVASLMSPAELAFHVERTIARSEALLCRLRDREAAVGSLVAVVHSLAGGAGMLGYRRFAHEAYRYERAVETATPDVEEIVAALIAAIEVSLDHMRASLAGISGAVLDPASAPVTPGVQSQGVVTH